ncbi:glycine cleavage system protein R [Vibrio ostreicida]|uniref:Glycine cleavage system transcriptional repressor n=1 Tax=Vibrio ostreicida TaxID=526588 RepID=A0ABT8BRF7_9VIBR|nr:ACT domain-containing protein [Vibrio ostreicida]MDN3609402.1 ACT domain-containing protein [Vibrio ostreicida]NPD08290.1 glycine cleavage system transcriptional repressor [Vibrio ostreicida]
MTHHLVITAVGTDRPGVCNQVVHLVTQSGCNIVDSRIALFGNDFTLIMLLSGNATAVTRVETTLPLLGQDLDLITITKRTSEHACIDNSYRIEVLVESEDKVGLTEKFTQFFADRNIGLSSLSAQVVDKTKALSTTNQFHIGITATCAAEYDMSNLEQEFNALCLSLDVKGDINMTNNSQ